MTHTTNELMIVAIDDDTLLQIHEFVIKTVSMFRVLNVSCMEYHIISFKGSEAE